MPQGILAHAHCRLLPTSSQAGAAVHLQGYLLYGQQLGGRGHAGAPYHLQEFDQVAHRVVAGTEVLECMMQHMQHALCS